MPAPFEKRTVVVDSYVIDGDKPNDDLNIERCESALAEAQRIGDKKAEGNCLIALGTALLFRAEIPAVLQCQQKALEIFQEINDRAAQAEALSQIGATYECMGQDEMSILHRGMALKILREVSDRPGEGDALTNISRGYFQLQQYKKALELDEKALVIFHDLGNREKEAVVLCNISRDYFYLQRLDQGNNYQNQAISLLPEISQNNKACLSILTNAAYFSFGQKKLDKAIEYYEQALTIARKTGDRSNEATILKSLALAHFEAGHGEASVELMEMAVHIYEELGSPLAAQAQEQVDDLRKRVFKKWWRFWE